MANLFCTIESERTEKHQIANKTLDIHIYYGSRQDSKLLAHILVIQDNPKPKLFFHSIQKPKQFTIRDKQK